MICDHWLAAPSPRISPPPTCTKYGATGTEYCSHASDDMTTGTSDGARSRSFEGLSYAVSLTTTTRRASPGSGCRVPGCIASQKVRHVSQPEVRNANSVRGLPSVKATCTASPTSVEPEMSAAGSAPSSRSGGEAIWTSGNESPPPAAALSPSAGRRRRISAWLRSRPATSTASRTSTSVSAATR